MAYNAVPTVSTGDYWSASNHNTYIRDNFAAGIPAIYTAKGDIGAATASGSVERVAAGTNRSILYALSTAAAGMTRGALSNVLWFGAQEIGASLTTSSGTYQDIPNAKISLTLPVISTVIALANGYIIRSGGTTTSMVRLVCGGSPSNEGVHTTSDTGSPMTIPFTVMYKVELYDGVNDIVVQAASVGGSTTVYAQNMIVMALKYTV